MDKSARYKADQKNLTPGLYISQVNGGITTYDMRFLKPNTPPFLSNPVIHTIEHLFKAYAGKSKLADNVIYFGPMGCQTGFYLLTRGVPDEVVLTVTKDVLRQILAYEGPVFGASRKECGNYRNLDLGDAKRECARYLAVLE